MPLHPGAAMSTRTRNDWILWAQLGCALVATAHAEYTLVTALGQHWIVAGAVTGALDLYVVRALQKHKDVLPAVLVMVAANVVSILITHRVVPVHWAVLAAVGALAPLLVWRGHRLRVHTGTPVPAVPVTVPADVPVQVSGPGAVSAPVPAGWASIETAPDHVPAWVQAGEAYPPLVPVPDLPDEYASGAVHSAVLEDSDHEYLDRAREYMRECGDLKRTPSVRGIRASLKDERGRSIGQARAQRLLAYMEVNP